MFCLHSIFIYFTLQAIPQNELISGTVVDQDGYAVKDAVVIVFSPTYPVIIKNGAADFRSQSQNRFHNLTDEDGKWYIKDPQEQFGVYMYHDLGYAIYEPESYENYSQTALRQWSKVEGNLNVFWGSNQSETISLHMRGNHPYVVHYHSIFFIYYAAKTNTIGKFSFEKVIASEWQVSHEIPVFNSSSVVSFKVIETKPNEGVHVSLESVRNKNFYTNILMVFFGLVLFLLLMFFYLHYSQLGRD